MPSIDDVFGGNTLKSDDIKGKNPTVTIDQFDIVEFTDKESGIKKKKLLLTFVGARKALVCNVTNARRIAHLYGPDYAQWPGKKIKLQVDMVDFGGRVTDGIRVYPPDNHQARPGGSPPITRASPREPAPLEDFPDDKFESGIPF